MRYLYTFEFDYNKRKIIIISYITFLLSHIKEAEERIKKQTREVMIYLEKKKMTHISRALYIWTKFK